GTDGAVAKRDQYLKEVGAEDAGVLGTLAADTARVLGNVGNTITFGVADRLGGGISSAASGGSFIDGFTGADGETSGAGQIATPAAQPRAAVSAGGPEAAQRPAAGAAPAAPSDVIGTANGRDITRAESDQLAGRMVGTVAPSASTSPAGALGAMPAAQAPTDFRDSDRMNRNSTQRGSEKRLEALYKQYNDEMSRGRRRSAAVVGDLIGKELGLVQGLAGANTPAGQQQPGSSPQDAAEAGRIGAMTEGLQLENEAKRSAQQALAEMLDETKTPEERAAAQRRLMAMRGESGQQKPIIERIMAADGSEQLVAIDPSTLRGQRVDVAAGGDSDLSPAAQNAIAQGADPAAVRARELQLRQAQGAQ
ncbi:MAG: hypothetical protein ACRC2H_09210, partial [Silanimonas sp.]